MKKIAFVIPLIVFPLTLSCNKGKEIVGYRENYTKRETYIEGHLKSTLTAEYNADGYQTNLIDTEYNLGSGKISSIVTTKKEYDECNHLIKYVSTIEIPTATEISDYKVVKITTYNAIYEGDFLSNESTSETNADGNVSFSSDTSYSETKIDGGYKTNTHFASKEFSKIEKNTMILVREITDDDVCYYDNQDRPIKEEDNNVQIVYSGGTYEKTVTNYILHEYIYSDSPDNSNYDETIIKRKQSSDGEPVSASTKISHVYSNQDTVIESVEYNYNDDKFENLESGTKSIHKRDFNTLTTYSESYDLKLNESMNEEWIKTRYNFSQSESKWKKTLFTYSELYSFIDGESRRIIVNSAITEYDEYGRPLSRQLNYIDSSRKGSSTQIVKSEYGDPIPIYKK